MNKPKFSSKKYSDTPYGDDEWERDFERWENAVIEEGEAKDIERLSEENNEGGK